MTGLGRLPPFSEVLYKDYMYYRVRPESDIPRISVNFPDATTQDVPGHATVTGTMRLRGTGRW